MRYLNKIENVQTFELGLRFAYSSGKGTIYVDGEEVDFPESSTFYLIEDKIYSATDYYINSKNELIRPIHLQGLYFRNIYCKTIKKYTKDSISYLFTDNIDEPLYVGEKNQKGNIISISQKNFFIKHENSIEVYSFISNYIITKIDLTKLVKGESRLFNNKIICLEKHIIMYLHEKNWSDYGFRVVDINSGECVFATNAFGPNIFYHEGKVYSVGRASQIMQVMHKDTFEIERIDLSDELGEFVFETQCTPYFHKNELYVALVKRGEDIYSYWGIIDLETNKLKFKTEMLRDFSKKPTKANKDFVSQIKANDTMVGVKVPGNILHIYEKP